METREVNGALLLEADPAWAEAIDTVLEEEGIRGEQLRWTGGLVPKSVSVASADRAGVPG